MKKILSTKSVTTHTYTHTRLTLSYNYVLNSTNSNQLIPVDQLPQGTYIVNLVANGDIIDTKNLVIN